MTKDDVPAFPANPDSQFYTGMTLRQFYATHALHGLLAGDHLSPVYIVNKPMKMGVRGVGLAA